jgi:hypothetical protein
MDRQVSVDEQVAVEVEDPADALPKSADAATSARGDGPWPSTSERAKPNQVRRDVPIGPLSASSAPNARTAMVGGGSARGPAPHGRDRRRTTPLRAPSAAARSRRVPLIVIQRQLGHSNVGITSIYLQGIDNAEIIEAVHGRRAPMVPVSATLRL